MQKLPHVDASRLTLDGPRLHMDLPRLNTAKHVNQTRHKARNNVSGGTLGQPAYQQSMLSIHGWGTANLHGLKSQGGVAGLGIARLVHGCNVGIVSLGLQG